MAPRPAVPAEIDLFTVPHSRMKELVNKYTLKVQDADYRDCQEVCTLLKELQMTLYEFKSHESIENMFIMDQLKNRLKQSHIYNSAVCNCHNDNRLQEMLALVKNGKHVWKTSIGERLSYGHELQKAFNDFVQMFLPHMEEEENIFQPLLIEHFEYDELRVLKEVVLEQHELIKDPLYQEKAELDDMPETDSAIKDFRDLDPDVCSLSSLYPTISEYDDVYSSDISREIPEPFSSKHISEELEAEVHFKGELPTLPSEIWIRIFRFLSPPDRGRCAQVCSSWNELIYTKSLWKVVYPIQWARGIWCFSDANLNYALQDEMVKNQLASLKQDEDADIDESEESLDPISQMENDFFISLICYLFPKVGQGVEQIILDGGQGLNSRLIHQALLLCPNVTHISATYTFFDYYTLKGLYHQGGLRKLKYLDLEGCEGMDDNALITLAKCLSMPTVKKKRLQQYCETQCCYITICPLYQSLIAGNGTCHNYMVSQQDTTATEKYASDYHYYSSQNLSSTEKCCRNINTDSYAINENAPTSDYNTEIEELYSPFGYQNTLPYCNGEMWVRGFQLPVWEPTLETINLSGCWRITNTGLISLLNSGCLKNIASLNLSSCFNLSGEALLKIAEHCVKLRPENLTYCSSIDNGPYISRANGCDSIDHPMKMCCRSAYQS